MRVELEEQPEAHRDDRQHDRGDRASSPPIVSAAETVRNGSRRGGHERTGVHATAAGGTGRAGAGRAVGAAAVAAARVTRAAGRRGRATRVCPERGRRRSAAPLAAPPGSPTTRPSEVDEGDFEQDEHEDDLPDHARRVYAIDPPWALRRGRPAVQGVETVEAPRFSPALTQGATLPAAPNRSRRFSAIHRPSARLPCLSAGVLASLPQARPTACGSASRTTPCSDGTALDSRRWTGRVRTRVHPADDRRLDEGRARAAAQATDPFDPAYQFGDVDEFVRNAQQRGVEVLITLWGTPSWANGGQKPQAMPRTWPTSRTSRAPSRHRYSGRYAGYPYVRFYTIWNESNLATFLVAAVQRKGQDRQPRELREARRAGIAGIKAGNRSRSSRSARRPRTAATSRSRAAPTPSPRRRS